MPGYSPNVHVRIVRELYVKSNASDKILVSTRRASLTLCQPQGLTLCQPHEAGTFLQPIGEPQQATGLNGHKESSRGVLPMGFVFHSAGTVGAVVGLAVTHLLVENALLYTVFVALSLTSVVRWHALVIRPSKTPGAGLGVYTDSTIVAGTIVCTYEGRLLGGAEAREMRKQDIACSSHMCALQGSGFVIDGKRAACDTTFPLGGGCGSMINCADAKCSANIKKVVVTTGGCYTRGTNDLWASGAVHFIATRHIAQGEELRFSYAKTGRNFLL